MGLLMEPVTVATDAFLVVGIRARTTNRIEAVAQTAKIPSLWQRFFADNIESKIPERLAAPEIIAVYSDYERDYQGPYSLVIGKKVRTLDRTPKGMVGVLVPAARYLRFAPENSTPEAVIETWHEIWRFFEFSHEYERAYMSDYEVHGPDETAIYVSVK